MATTRRVMVMEEEEEEEEGALANGWTPETVSSPVARASFFAFRDAALTPPSEIFGSKINKWVGLA